jgi:F0F1-type ATP synthase membrane subunit c/vacuolar-type H+-ATPase subunit K
LNKGGWTVIDREALNKAFVTMKLIWAALLASLAIYVLVCHLWGEEIRANVSADIPVGLLRSVLYVVAVAELFLAYFLRKSIIKGRFGGAGRDLVPHAAQADTGSIVNRYMVAIIVSLAISDSIGIYGLILFLLGDELMTLYTFVAISAAAMFYFRPKMEELEQLVRDART